MYKFFLFLFIVLLLAVIVVYPYSVGSYYSEPLLLYTLSVSAIALTLFIFSALIDPVRELRTQYIRPIYMFLLGYIIVFFQAYIDLYLENLNPNSFFFLLALG